MFVWTEISRAFNGTETADILRSEPVFVDILRSPGIDYQPGGPV
jgi:hypothetical protein